LGHTNKRRQARPTTIKSGQLLYGGAHLTVVDCLVLDISETGARVETILSADIPEICFLRLNDGSQRQAYRRWASGHQIGLEFVAKAD
jgi:hypothetical protein